jgi:aspartyl-tRNA(Asn)/glutamyl-tRNA(Gln) amidotransferase subunit B
MAWEIVVGLETHAQLLTASKMFSAAPTAFGAPPNTQASAVDIALPGTLPVANRAAVEHAVRFGLAVGGSINRRSIFARKNYFYPDLPKGYQISQYESPIVQGGALQIEGKTVRLTRAHLEEDAGKSLHDALPDRTGIDLNRAGTPLLEIVSEPDLRGPKEAVAYARTLHTLVVWIGICDGNMQEGSFRCDANVSVRKSGDPALGTRCEIKNLNSFRFMEQAIEFEAKRQIAILEEGGKIDQETRLYDPERNETRSMRTKEDAHDYRYFPDPDLLPLVVSEKMIDDIRKTMPELPQEKRSKFERYGIPSHTASALTSTIDMARFYEAMSDHIRSDRSLTTTQTQTILTSAANTTVSSLSSRIDNFAVALTHHPELPKQLAMIEVRSAQGRISSTAAKEVREAVLEGGGNPDEIIKARGLEQISDVAEIDRVINEVITANPKQVDDYRSGKEKALNSLVGQVMKATKGKADPTKVNDLLRAKLVPRMDDRTRMDITSVIDRIERILSKGDSIATEYGVFIDLLILLRDLLNKTEKFVSRVSFDDDVIQTKEVKDVTDLVAFIRNAVAHPESKNHLTEAGNIKSSFNVVVGKGVFLRIGDKEFGNPYQDDVAFLFGPQRILLHRHIIRAYQEAKGKLLPYLVGRQA